MATTIPAQSEWFRAKTNARDVGVDRENNILKGYVMAQEGVLMESEPRGEFDAKSLKKLVALARKKSGGLKSRFTHPSLSGDGLGTFLGRVKNVRMDSVTVDRDDGIQSLLAVRGDLYLDKTSFDTPNGNLGKYVMDLAESDSDAFASSVVIKYDEEFKKGEDGKDDFTIPPLLRPFELHASDIVDQGAAVDGMFSADITADGLPDELVRKGCELLANFLPGQPRDVVEARLNSWLQRALSLRFSEEDAEESELAASAEDLERRIRHMRRHRKVVA